MSTCIRKAAEDLSLQSFLNCYLRETGACAWQRERAPGLWGQVIVPLTHLRMALLIDVSYRSLTGRHRYGGKVLLQSAGAQPAQVDPITAAMLLARELTDSSGVQDHKQLGLLSRMIDSCKRMELYLHMRSGDLESIHAPSFTFIQAEQSLLLGHAMHPTPKSREGLPEWQEPGLTPECKGAFRLHWFCAHPSIVLEGSESEKTASVHLTELIQDDERFPQDLLQQQDAKWTPLPLHPLQAAKALEAEHVRDWLERGVLKYLGPLGREYRPTSSMRTIYHEDSAIMLKLSMPARLTNSVRVNKCSELVAGAEAARLWKTEVGKMMEERFPAFRVIGDPAWMTLHDGREGLLESGFEIIIRDNPFRGAAGEQVAPIAALCQEALPDCPSSRLHAIIGGIAEREGRPVTDVALCWFRRYLDISLRPMLWLYANFGIGLEAHGQNSLVRLQDGYPENFYFRDNQGYYYRRSKLQELNALLPGIGESSGNVYDDELVDERVRYYLFINHLFGLINGFGMAGLIEEGVLLAELRSTLEGFQAELLESKGCTLALIDGLLDGRTISCKANLLTVLSGIDELEQHLEQAVYVEVDNPLVSQIPGREMLQRAKRATVMWRQERVRHG
ncbi:IucA/IucC family protein [Paenibacillus sp. strain BS8-2]